MDAKIPKRSRTKAIKSYEESDEEKPIMKKIKTAKIAGKVKTVVKKDDDDFEPKKIPRNNTNDWQMQAEMVGKSILEVAKHSKKCLGAHVSAAGGVHNSLYNAVAIGCRSFALFLKNQRRWDSKPLNEEEINLWNKALKETKFDLSMIVPHGSYLLNAASPNPELRDKTRDSLIDEVSRCQKLGIQLYNFHPGSTTGKCTLKEGISHIAGVLDQVIEATENVTILLETMAGQKNVVGGRFEDIKQIIDTVKPKNRSRVGVCLDTCHIFVAGYDIRTKKTYMKTMKEFDDVIGFDYLKAFHLNDSKTKHGSHLDRHECINHGELKSFFPLLMRDERFDNIPMILETPEMISYADEMKHLYNLDVKTEDDEELEEN